MYQPSDPRYENPILTSTFPHWGREAVAIPALIEFLESLFQIIAVIIKYRLKSFPVRIEASAKSEQCGPFEHVGGAEQGI